MLLTKQTVFDLHADAIAAGEPLHLLELALLVAMSAHRGQTRHNGEPYLIHPLDVSSNDPLSMRARIVRLLHDVIEDTKDKPPADRWTLDDLRILGFPEDHIEGVVALTKRPEEEGKYFDFMVRIGQTEWRCTKMADIFDNIQNCKPEKLEVYHLAYDYLEALEKKRIAPGTAFGVWMANLPMRKQRWDLFDRESTETPPAGTGGRLVRAFDMPSTQCVGRNAQTGPEISGPVVY